MDASPNRASTPVEDSVLNNTAFSMDSLQIGDSTRSLLSPLYNKEKGSDGQSFCNEKILSEKESIHDSTRSSSSDSIKSDRSYSDESETTVKKGKAKKLSKSSHSSTSRSSSSSYSNSTKTSKTESSGSRNSSKSSTEHELPLSPWEKWLLSKVVEDKERVKTDKRKKKIQEDIEHQKMTEKSEKEIRAEVNRKEWLKLKRNEEKVKNELAVRLENEKAQQKLEAHARIQEKAEESYKKWLEAKEDERKEQRKNRRMSKKERKEKELERKQQSEEAYKLWLEKSKQHEKLQNNHFGYIGGKVTGYYDWTTYPMPSYNNPNPWVSPKVRTRYQSKIKLQNPSPPLLFKDLEERERKTRQNVKTKCSRNSVC